MRTKLLVFAVFALAVIFACTLPSGSTGEVGVPTFQATIAPTHLPFSKVYIDKPQIEPWGTAEINEYWLETNEVGIEINLTVISPERANTKLNYELKCDGVRFVGEIVVGLNMIECNSKVNVQLRIQDTPITNSNYIDHDYMESPKTTVIYLGTK